MISLKRPREIELMRDAGRLVAEAHCLIRKIVEPGVTTAKIDETVECLFDKHGATPLFKGVPNPTAGKRAFPSVCCISVNEQVVHGIPGDRRLEAGDIVKVDTGCRLNGWCGDSAWTYAVGKIDPVKQRLMQVGEENLYLAIREIGRCKRWSEVAAAMEQHVKLAGFSVVEQFVGHGIGREMHEDPQVPNFVSDQLKKHDFRLEPGLVLAIEPMVNAGTKAVRVLKDHWTVETRDRKPSVHFEHTVAITDDGPLILTTRDA
ncbi:MAG: type I methionyl aminopeptidase [Planctomycetaceae bacterium]|nr:type I methionyl aminopeptidase [Planctomycetaceae bacterium]